jgi:hypothetical protein
MRPMDVLDPLWWPFANWMAVSLDLKNKLIRSVGP